MSVQFVDCGPDQLPALQEFYARMYRPDYILAVNADYFRWQFGNTPISTRDNYHMRLALVDGEITGCLGYIPLELSLAGRVERSAWLANWMVDPNTRQFGLGPLLVRDIAKDFDILLAAGPNKDAHSLLERMGWTDFGQLPRYVAVLDPETAGKLTESGTLDWPAGALQAAQGKQNLNVQVVENFNEDATRLWDETYGATSGGTRRSADFLNWRYKQHAVFGYRKLEARSNGKLDGMAIYRVEQVRDMPVKVGRIVEFVAQESAEDDLLSALLADAREQGCAALDFFCSSGRVAGVMDRHGFLPGSNEAALQVPVLFQPIDRRRAGIVVMADLRKAPGGPDIKDWYLTKADGDQDRPN